MKSLARLVGHLIVLLFALAAGLPMTDRSRHLRYLSGATWLRGGSKVVKTKVEHLHWYAWAGWQRSVVRLLAALLLLLLLLWPLWTALTLGAVLGAGSLTALAARRRARLALGPARVKAVTR